MFAKSKVFCLMHPLPRARIQKPPSRQADQRGSSDPSFPLHHQFSSQAGRQFIGNYSSTGCRRYRRRRHDPGVDGATDRVGDVVEGPIQAPTERWPVFTANRPRQPPGRHSGIGLYLLIAPGFAHVLHTEGSGGEDAHPGGSLRQGPARQGTCEKRALTLAT